MKFVFQSLYRIVTVIFITFVIILGTTFYLAYRSIPEYDAQFTIDAVTAPVEIIRDPSAVPHIIGTSNADVMFALGYAHAQDRLWQMIIARRTVQGRLAEIFGPRSVTSDELMRHLGLYRAARQSVDAQSPEALDMLKAYSAGVNARLQRINENSMGRGAPELLLYNVAISPWRPVDSIALLKLTALQSSQHAHAEIRRALTSMQVQDPARLADLFPLDPGQTILELPRYSAQFDAPLPVPHHNSALATQEITYGFGGASNAFAAAPKRTAQGKPVLANDPHGPLTAPTAWYLARLELETGGVIGATLPGIPAIFSGRAADVAWGITASFVDDQDITMEEVSAQGDWRRSDGTRRLTTRASIIQIKGQEPLTVSLYEWPMGMASLPSTFGQIALVTPKDHIPTLHSPALLTDDTSYTALWTMMQAKDIDELKRAAQAMIAPSYNVIMADETSVSLKTIGAAPLRAATHLTQGKMPSLGLRAENQWQGFVDYNDLPEVTSTDEAIVLNTNNKLSDAAFPNHLSFDWGDTQRIRRLTNLMNERAIHSRDSFIEAQLDTVSYTARSLSYLVAKELWYSTTPAQMGTVERDRTQALELLAKWDGDMNEHMPEPLIYAAWMQILQRNILQDELSHRASLFQEVDPVFLERVFRNIDGAGIWCDIKQTTPVEDCPLIAQRSLDEALIFLKETYQNDITALRWGDAHTAIHRNATLGQWPIVKWFANLQQSVSGGPQTLNRTKGTGALSRAGFQTIHGTTYRGVYDFSDPDSSLFVTSTGQSGHILSRHYDDLGQKWRRGEYIPMSLDLDLAKAGGVGTMVIRPPTPQTEP